LLCCLLLLSQWPAAKHLKDRLEFLAYDYRMQYWPRHQTHAVRDQQVVIVAIDEKSLHELGRWPWPRRTMASLYDALAKYQAAVVAFDIIFAEQQPQTAQRVLAAAQAENIRIDETQKQRLLEKFDGDTRLAESFKRGDVVLGYIFHAHGDGNINVLPSVSAVRTQYDIRSLTIRRAEHYTGNLQNLQTAAPFGGFVTTQPDSDGVLRRSPLLLEFGDNIYPSLALECVRLFYLLDSIDLHVEKIGNKDTVEYVLLGKTAIPTDSYSNMLIPYLGPSPQIQHISATDILHHRIPARDIENRIVLVGTTALGLTDFTATPVQNVFPGVEVHAHMIQAMLENQFIHQPPWARGADFAVLLCTGLLLGLLLPCFSVGRQTSFTLLVLGCLCGGNIYLWQMHGLSLSLSLPVVLSLNLLLFNLAYGYLTESQSKKALQSMFGQYVPPERVDAMVRSGKPYHFDGESRELSVLFADIRNFTSLSEALSPVALKDWLNQFFTHMTGIIFEHKGTIDKYVGDMIMAFWGAPLDNPDHACDALQAAQAMLRKTHELKSAFAAQGLPAISIGIGINTGTMNVGDMGSKYRRSYTVLGDAVNLASRIEGLTKFYGAELVIGEQTAKYLQNELLRCLDRVRVKGKSQAVKVYQTLGPVIDADSSLLEEIERFHHAQQLYLQQDWQNARDVLMSLKSEHPDTAIYSLYLQRIEHLTKLELDPRWDGVFERREK